MSISFPARLILTIVGVILASLLGAYWVRGNSQWLPLGISIASFVIAILAAFKRELFAFSPRVLGGDIVFAPTNPPSDSLSLVLPLQFINDGYGEGVVKWVAVKLEAPGLDTPAVMGPVTEVDLQQFLQHRRHLHAENMLGAFAPFRLEAKEATAKALLFTEEGDNEPRQVDPGTWNFSVHLMTSAKDKPIEMISFSHEITDDILDNFIAGTGSYILDRNIQLE